MSTLICWLQDVEDRPVSLVGGKGANLGRLARMGLPVPQGFAIAVEAYRAFLVANSLTGATPEALRVRIPDAPMSAEIGAAVLDAYQQLGVSNVAVRSSGTAEDLAGASFAGQHDTFLNVEGPEARWLVECRGSLVALAHKFDGEELSALSDEDLMDRVETLQRLQVDLFVPRFGYFPRGMLITQGLSFLLRLAVGTEAASMQSRLLSGIPCKTTEVKCEAPRSAPAGSRAVSGSS